MFFTQTLYLSLAICLVGMLLRLYTWLTLEIGPHRSGNSLGTRLKAAVAGFAKAVLSFKLFTVIKVLVLDVILQVWVARNDFSRWLMHALIFFGFMGLLLLHALDGFITEPLFPGYESTLNPFFSLRNVLGFMVVTGVALAIFRRLRIQRLRATTNRMDIYAIIILAVIIGSGFLLESAQIISESLFNEMVVDYMGLDDPEEAEELKVYWAEYYGVVFDDATMEVDEEMLAEGLAMHEESCLDCHDRPTSAFISYPLARLISPLGSALNRIRFDLVLWHVHFLACFIGLAYLPFSRFFHIVASPLSLIVNGLAQKAPAATAGQATRRAMALDACTHCGTCSVHCSVEPVFQVIGNKAILPSEKLLSTFQMATGKPLDDLALTTLSDGSFICTECYRCTTVCPVGIDLQDLWRAAREQLKAKGYPSPYGRLRKENGQPSADQTGTHHPALALDPATGKKIQLPWNDTTFSACFECQTCTNACPVVSLHQDPGEALHLLPHQIMHSVGLGLTKMTLKAAMVWDCVTCYQCQEQCPQGVQVTDVLYALKNMAWQEEQAGGNGTKTEKRVI